MPLQAGFLGETVVAVAARKLAFTTALPLHVSAQIAEHCVAASAILAGEARLGKTCRMKENVILRMRPCACGTSKRAIFRDGNFSVSGVNAIDQ